MLTFWVFILAVILVIPSLCANAVSNCPDTTLHGNEADAILKLINAARDKLRRGEQRNGLTGYNLPAAVSMPDLEWNCTAEKEAVTSLKEYCQGPANWSRPAEAFTMAAGSEVPALYRLNLLLKTMDFVDLESVKNGVAEGGKVLSNGHIDLTGYSCLANAKAKSIACARHKCKLPGANADTYLMQCRTDVPKVNANETLYNAVAEPNACPSNAFMHNSVRKAFLQKHNSLRSLLAMGVVVNGNTREMLGEVKNMPSLIYDCDLEKIAYERAKLCEKFDHTKTDIFKENYLKLTEKLDRDAANAAKSATQRWWSSLSASNGVDQFRNLYYANQNFNSFAKIASDLTTKIGCAIYNCTNMVNVVCRYDTTLGHGASLYNSGPKCNGCPNMCANGLCRATVAGANI